MKSVGQEPMSHWCPFNRDFSPCPQSLVKKTSSAPSTPVRPRRHSAQSKSHLSRDTFGEQFSVSNTWSPWPTSTPPLLQQTSKNPPYSTLIVPRTKACTNPSNPILSDKIPLLDIASRTYSQSWTPDKSALGHANFFHRWSAFYRFS